MSDLRLTSYSEGFGIFNKVSEEEFDVVNKNYLRMFMLNTENKLFNYDEMYDYILPNITKYVFSRKRFAEIENNPSKQGTIILDALNHLRPIENEADKGAGGELGEILLYLFLEQDLHAPKLFSKVELKTSAKDYVKGSDGIHFKFRTNSEGIKILQLVIGEAKIKNELKKGIDEAFESIEKYLSENTQDRNLLDTHLMDQLVDKEEAELIKEYIVEILLKGCTNLLELGENYSDRGFTETTYEYAAKCLNMLLHDICNQNDSYIVRDFRKEKVLSPQNIIDIRKKFGGIVSKDDDINLSARQKESLYKAVKERNLNYPKTLDYNTCLSFLMQLSTILRWDLYEKETLGKGQRIRYYTVILTQWMQSRGLHEIIRGAIEHYQQNGGNLVSFEPEYHLEPYNNSAKHKNQVINEVMKDLEHVINYKLSMYFLRLSEAIVKPHGKTALENDWYEYVEYGTCNIEIILLQKYGFLREEALLLLKPNYSDYIRIDNQTIKIRRNIVDVVTDDLHSSLKTIMINYPEIFID